MGDFEKKRTDGEELAKTLGKVPQNVRESLLQRIAGMVEGAALAQAAAEKQAS